MLLRQRKRNRLKDFNYSQSGWYFVTICTKNRIEYFGNVVDRKMILNHYGEILKKCWFEIPKHYKNTSLDEFMIMPNHAHGILIIKNVGNRHACSLQNDIKRNNQTLFAIIGSFKSASTKLIHEMGLNSFRWQKSFYDHIIRNERSLWTIRQYIRNNVRNWEKDKNNVENLF